MSITDLILLGKNLVIEYIKRYKNKIYDIEKDEWIILENLTNEDILIRKTSQDSDGLLEVILEVIKDPWWQYKILYNPNDNEKIKTIIEMK